MPIVLVVLLVGGFLVIARHHGDELDSSLDSDTRKAVQLALQKETDPSVLHELSDRLRTAGFPIAAGTVEAKARSLS